MVRDENPVRHEKIAPNNIFHAVHSQLADPQSYIFDFFAVSDLETIESRQIGLHGSPPHAKGVAGLHDPG